MWAFGITIYQMATGEHPFNTSDDADFRDSVINGKVDLSRLAAYSPRIRRTVENLLKTDMYKRWDANMVLTYC
jgi:serine/threonine protein kinase